MRLDRVEPLAGPEILAERGLRPLRGQQPRIRTIAIAPRDPLMTRSQIMADKPETIHRERVGRRIGSLDEDLMLSALSGGSSRATARSLDSLLYRTTVGESGK